jgi:hypothetical protein
LTGIVDCDGSALRDGKSVLDGVMGQCIVEPQEEGFVTGDVSEDTMSYGLCHYIQIGNNI